MKGSLVRHVIISAGTDGVGHGQGAAHSPRGRRWLYASSAGRPFSIVLTHGCKEGTLLVIARGETPATLGMLAMYMSAVGMGARVRVLWPGPPLRRRRGGEGRGPIATSGATDTACLAAPNSQRRYIVARSLATSFTVTLLVRRRWTAGAWVHRLASRRVSASIASAL